MRLQNDNCYLCAHFCILRPVFVVFALKTVPFCAFAVLCLWFFTKNTLYFIKNSLSCGVMLLYLHLYSC